MITLNEFEHQHSSGETTYNIVIAFGLEWTSERIARQFYEKVPSRDSHLKGKPVSVWRMPL